MIKKAFYLFFIFSIYTFSSFSENDYKFIGQHFIASYSDCDQTALTAHKGIQTAMLEAVEATGATVLSYTKHPFSNDGFSMIILLSESHASIHTYPEFNACFLDIFTCGTTCELSSFDKIMKAYLKPKFTNIQYLDRS